MAEGNGSNGKRSKLETLREQQARIAARITEMERVENAKARKRDTRIKVLVGAACMADAGIHDATKGALRSILDRAVKADRDRELLKSAGWL